MLLCKSEFRHHGAGRRCSAGSGSHPVQMAVLGPVHRRQAVLEPRQVTCRSSASNNSTSADSHAGHAVLHDFCMTLPYGTISLVTGVVSFFVGEPLRQLAVPVAALGAAMLLLAVLSLKGWKQGKSSAPFTLLSAGAAGTVSYLSIPYIQGGVVGWVAGALAALSGAAALFCLYNVLAGGNPPRTGKH